MIEAFTCITKNIVYGIIYKRCHIIYIWETGRRLADRITEHIRSIRNIISELPVVQDINPLSCRPLNDFAVTGIALCNCQNVNRLNIYNSIVLNSESHLPMDLTQNLAHSPLREFKITSLCFCRLIVFTR